jgi:CO/xanthine dehydrogenase Mo-binding subunit
VTKKVIGRRIKRNEDPRLLTGQALFVDDVQMPGMLHVAFLRSDYAHARLRSIDVTAARGRPGVVAVYTAEDLGSDWKRAPALVSPPPTIKEIVFHSRTQVPLVKDTVRHAGEPLAMVVAESRYIAEDAVEDILVDLEPLPAVIDMEKALEPGSPLVHDDLESNLAAHLVQKKGDYEAARAQADLVIERRIVIDRGVAGAMENRGIVAHWEPKSQHLTLWDTTQAPIPIRNGLAAMFGLLATQVRVIAPFVGGGFGPKIMMYYPEEVMLTWATLKLGLPLKWIEDRRENFFATTMERSQVHDASHERGAHPGHPPQLPARHGGLRPLRPDRPPQHPEPRHGELRRAQLHVGPEGGLYQPHHRHARAGSGPAAGHLPGGAPARPGSQAVGHGPRGDPAPQSDPARCLPRPPGDHRPGVRGADL